MADLVLDPDRDLAGEVPALDALDPGQQGAQRAAQTRPQNEREECEFNRRQPHHEQRQGHRLAVLQGARTCLLRHEDRRRQRQREQRGHEREPHQLGHELRGFRRGVQMDDHEREEKQEEPRGPPRQIHIARHHAQIRQPGHDAQGPQEDPEAREAGERAPLPPAESRRRRGPTDRDDDDPQCREGDQDKLQAEGPQRIGMPCQDLPRFGAARTTSVRTASQAARTAQRASRPGGISGKR